MTDLPKTVQWVLDFVNIYNTPGKFKIYSFPAKFKRIPIPQKKDLPNLVIENDRIINRSTGDEWRIIRKTSNIDPFELEKKIEAFRAKRLELLKNVLKNVPKNVALKEKKYPLPTIEMLRSNSEKKYAEEKRQNELDEVIKLVSSEGIEKKIEYWGNTADLGLENYKDFFLKNGIPPFKGTELLLENHEPLSTLDTESFAKRPKRNNEPGYYEYYQDNPPIEFLFSKEVVNVFCELSSNLSDLVMGTGTYKSLVLSIAYIKNLYRDYIFKDKPIIPGVLYACIANSGIDDQEICSRLRQCPYCGRLWIPEKKRGRPEKFCSDVCRERHDDQPREANKEAVKNTRINQKPKKQKEDYKTLVEYLKQKTYTPKDAEDEARKWVCTYGKSFKEYKRTRGTILEGL
ncbi:MAG: hypothetical protein HY607_06150 [Planctomycetes bacterium]|uniref:hypothetical protein n=1 Tax=Candidatus Wunengus californicus TaxID=3367619 RepID=UPI0040271B01|nr:hypothetical protein [Planctomycetota bacterium]